MSGVAITILGDYLVLRGEVQTFEHKSLWLESVISFQPTGDALTDNTLVFLFQRFVLIVTYMQQEPIV